MLRVATKIKDLVCESHNGMTEKDIRVVVGDNVGTGKALRSLISQGHLKRMGRGERAPLALPHFTARFNIRQVVRAILTCMKWCLDFRRCPCLPANKGHSCIASSYQKNKNVQFFSQPNVDQTPVFRQTTGI